MNRVTAAAVLLVALASPLQAQTSTTGTADSGGVVRTNMNSTTTPSGTNSNMNENYNNGATTTSGTTSTGATDNDVNGTAGTGSNLPATASPLPLLSLGSLGALASGLWLSRRRQA
jgi:hypothetical protein